MSDQNDVRNQGTIPPDMQMIAFLEAFMAGKFRDPDAYREWRPDGTNPEEERIVIEEASRRRGGQVQQPTGQVARDG